MNEYLFLSTEGLDCCPRYYCKNVACTERLKPVCITFPSSSNRFKPTTIESTEPGTDSKEFLKEIIKTLKAEEKPAVST